MSAFDSRIFAQAVVADVTPHVAHVIDRAVHLRAQLDALQTDVERTLNALQAEADVGRAAALRLDLEVFLPARKAAILSASKSRLTGDVQAAFEAALSTATRAVLVVA